jgi:hypothetical protein
MHSNVKTLALGVVWAIVGSGAAWAQPLPIPIPQRFDPLLANLPIPADAATHGMWSPVKDWPLIPIHASLMPDGRVVTFGSPPNANGIEGRWFDVWNPRRGFVAPAHRWLQNMPTLDSFCAASTLLTTGELLTSGGTPATGGNTQGASRVNAATTSVSSNASLLSPRYYATQTALSDGRVLVTGGSISAFTTYSYNNPAAYAAANFSSTPEVYTLGGSWQSLTTAQRFLPADPDSALPFGAYDNRWWYPRQWVAPNGLVFGYSTNQMWIINPNANSGWGSITNAGNLSANSVPPDFPNNTPIHQFNNPRPNIGGTSTAAMFDVGKILQVGGNGMANGDLTQSNTWSSAKSTVIDINSGMPSLSDGGDMFKGRQWANATVLPNGRVLVTGGTTFGNTEDSGHTVREPQIWDPSGVWLPPGPPADRPRVYHSTSLLLPNGTVMTGGGGGVNDHPGQLNAEVYYPAYLFAASGGTSVLASRPRVLSMNALKFSHGATIQAEFAGPISTVALIGLGSVTHGFDMGQRFIPISSPSFSGTRVSFPAPGNTIAPPGYYMLFVSNAVGVPSEGVIIAIGSTVASPPRRQQQFDADGDGVTDFGIWRPRPWPEIPTASPWQVFKSTTSNTVWEDFNHGGIRNHVSDVVVPGDYDGDGRSDYAVYIPRAYPSVGASIWQVRLATGVMLPNLEHGGIINGRHDIPVPGDYDGDGKSDYAIYRPRNYSTEGPSLWQVVLSGGGLLEKFHGAIIDGIMDIPVPGDYDGDGKSDFAIFRPRLYNGTASLWQIWLSSNNTLMQVEHGGIINGVTDIPVPGDYDGDGKTDVAIYRPRDYFNEGASIWQILQSGGGGVITSYHGGIMNGVHDIPVPGDYDGDGKTDLGIYRPQVYIENVQTSLWQIWRSSNNTLLEFNHGAIIGGVTDLPLTALTNWRTCPNANQQGPACAVY